MLNALRTCTKCGVEKSLDQFHKQKRCPLGHRPECKECCNARNKLYYKRNREEIIQWARAYNKTDHRRFYSRNYRAATRPRPMFCECCGNHGAEKRGIVFDHDHSTGLFRGWLCNRCNRVLGMCGDNPVLLRLLANYLEVAK